MNELEALARILVYALVVAGVLALLTDLLFNTH